MSRGKHQNTSKLCCTQNCVQILICNIFVISCVKTTEMKQKKKAKRKETLREFLNKNPFISEMPEHERY